jgi:hypothetical protein
MTLALDFLQANPNFFDPTVRAPAELLTSQALERRSARSSTQAHNKVGTHRRRQTRGLPPPARDAHYSARFAISARYSRPKAS